MRRGPCCRGVAAATTRIRVATRVLGVPYRNPAMVAKMAETFGRLSGGRLILSLQAKAVRSKPAIRARSAAWSEHPPRHRVP